MNTNSRTRVWLLMLPFLVCSYLDSHAAIVVNTFHDANNNGTRETNEALLSGLSVGGVDEQGAIHPFEANGVGSFILNDVPSRMRIQVSGYSDQLLQGVAGPTSIFFVDDGAIVDVPISKPETIDLENTQIIIPCYEKGSAANKSTSPAIVSFPYNVDGVASQYGGDEVNPRIDVTIDKVGSTWGIAYQRNLERVFASSILKRHVEMGPEGPGAIYTLDYNSPGETPKVSSFDLQGYKPAVGPEIDLGTVKRTLTDDVIDETTPYALTTVEKLVDRASYDIDAFDKVGKLSYGDIDVTEDEEQLWIVNLHQRSLIQMDVSQDEINVTAPNLKHYMIDELGNLPDLRYRFRKCINVGGNKNDKGAEAFTDANGVAWDRNKYSSGGKSDFKKFNVANTMNVAEGTSDAHVYQTWRKGRDFTYDIPVPQEEKYEVILHFIEPFNHVEGDRIFDVYAEGKLVLNDFDIVKEAGSKYRAITKKIDVNSTGETLTLEFKGQFGGKVFEAVVQGIEINGESMMTTGVLRPWGLSFHDGKGYLGLTSDASISQSRDHLHGYVMSFDPNNMAAGLHEEVAFKLNYPRERASNADQEGPQVLRTAAWMPWVETWEETHIPLDDERSFQGALLCSYPQPLISDINFAEDGSMVIGLMDRWAHQTGYLNYSTILGNTRWIIGYASGDILKAFKMPAGDYALELTNFDDGLYYTDDDGPSYDGEFFYRDGFRSQDIAHHGETVTGGMGILRGTNEVVTTVHNPRETFLEHFEFAGAFTQGIHFYSTENGDQTHSYLFVDQFNLGKANGLGDIEFARSMHLGEAGNYLWCDGNGNGIQDPAEMGIEGIELVLHDKDNSLAIIDQTTTDASGNYTFGGLREGHCYEIRIDLDQLTALGFSGMASPLHMGTDSLVDSNADLDMLPGFAVAMFCMDEEANNRHDLDFGFGGPAAVNAIKFECEDPMTGCAVFTLAAIESCVDTSGLNQVTFYNTFNDADSLQNEITAATVTVCDVDVVLYARVSSSTDPACFSISQVTLREIRVSSGPQDFNVVICPGTDFDALAFLRDQGYRGDMTTELFSDALMTMPLTNPVMIPMLPYTIYYDDTTGTQNCAIMGAINLTGRPAAMVEAGDSMEICGVQCVDLTALGTSFSANGSGATSASWTSSGTGSFLDDNSYAGARFYCPSTLDMMNGRVVLTLAVTDDPCGRTIEDSVAISIIESTPRFMTTESDTIDCIHPFVDEQVLNDTFPRCRLVANCVDTVTATVIDYEVTIGNCDENIVKYIVRTQRVNYQKEEYFCTDTIFVRGLDFTDFICPPERDSVYCHSNYLRDENGHPSPLETGVPMVGDLPLWPQPSKACDILIQYKDLEFSSECPMTLRRTWLIKNNCTGDFIDSCVQWLMIYDTLGPYLKKDLDKALVADSLAFPALDKPVIFVPAGNHDCEGHTYIPPVYASDTCSDVKIVKARIPDIGSYVLTYNPATDKWESHETAKIPRSEDPIPIIYEAYDHCHNVTLDTCYFYVKDLTKPVAVCDKGINVTISDTTVWVAAEVFDEGSWDNCGISLLLARRADWATACGVNLCDNVVSYCGTEHHDSLYCAVLEQDKHIDPIEAHYAETLRWLCEDESACSDFIIGGWWYDLIKYATLECVDHPYEVNEEYLKQIFADPTLTCTNDPIQVGDVCTKLGFDFTSNLPDFPAPFFSESIYRDFDLVSQIGGGWSKEVPFCCSDACGEVTVEVLAMDYWCNWSKCWTTVYVEDKTPPEVVSDLFDLTMSCTSYKAFYEEAVHQAQEGDFTLLDSLLGGYDKVAYDQYDNLPLKTPFAYNNVRCDSILVTKDSLFYDEHLGYKWKTYQHYEAVYDTTIITRYRGQIADDCGLLCFEDQPWVNLDHCGNGFIKRTFHFVGQCQIDDVGHKVDTITKYQTIWIQSDCALSRSMFKMPEDVILEDCGLEYDPSGNGNAAGVVHPKYTGEPTYVFKDDCKLIGVGYYDKVYKIVGGDESCYKIFRTWCFADWCHLDEFPKDVAWWFDDRYAGKYFSHVQKIILIDTVPPECNIDLPDVIESSSCTYDLNTMVEVKDECGVLDFSWTLIDDKTGATISSDDGKLNSDTSSAYAISVPGLLPGVYQLKTIITDDCQNESHCKKEFIVEPRKKPAPICITSLTLQLNAMDRDGNGEIDTAMGTIWANEFDVSSAPACGSDPDQLEFRLDRSADGEPALPDSTSLTFGCADIGTHVLRMYVLDETDTWDYCEIVLIVQDNNDICGSGENDLGLLSGVLLTESNWVIQQADVSIKDEDGSVMMSEEMLRGAYRFELPTGSKAYIEPFKDTDHINGVSTRDLIDIQKHLIGKEALPTWHREIAADANADGKISPRDIIEFRQLILGKSDRLSDNTSWRFFDRRTQSEAYHINPMLSVMRVDFTGVKIGDVNLDNDPARRAPRSNDAVILQANDNLLERGERQRIAITSRDLRELNGFQFTLSFDASHVGIEDVIGANFADLGKQHFNLDHLSAGWLTASWFDKEAQVMRLDESQPIFYLDLVAKRDIRISEVLTFTNKVTRTEAYDASGVDRDIAMVFDQSNLIDHTFKLYQNRPNPFTEGTSIG
ncbi:MAG: hypothetical protein HKN87_07415, partial [Saprospiraceae bacterium]|nr:hypothetical protein [Saprospiraceae bacterium]